MIIHSKLWKYHKRGRKMEKLVMNVQEVAEALGISRSYAYELMRNGTIPTVQLGRKRVVSKEKLNEWINEKSELR